MVLAAIMFVAHAVAAGSTFPRTHNHTVPQAGASYVVEDASGGTHWSCKQSSATDHQHSEGETEKPTCCGEACLMAVMPGEEPHLDKPLDAPSRTLMVVSSLAGQDPDGLRRPPRLLPLV